MTPIHIMIPWPPSALLPNAARRLNWRQRGAAAKAYRLKCWATTLEQGAQHNDLLPNGDLLLDIQFCAPDRRRRDLDNLLAAIKPAIDGVATSLQVDDSRFTQVMLHTGAKVTHGAVYFRISQAVTKQPNP